MPAAAICDWISFALATSASAMTWTTKPGAACALAAGAAGAAGALGAVGGGGGGLGAAGSGTGAAAGSASFVMAFFSSGGEAGFFSPGGGDFISVERRAAGAAGSAEPGATGTTREVNAESGGGILMDTS